MYSLSSVGGDTGGSSPGASEAALSLRGQKDTAGLVRSFTGSHRFVLDYLAEEVLLAVAEGGAPLDRARLVKLVQRRAPLYDKGRIRNRYISANLEDPTAGYAQYFDVDRTRLRWRRSSRR